MYTNDFVIGTENKPYVVTLIAGDIKSSSDAVYGNGKVGLEDFNKILTGFDIDLVTEGRISQEVFDAYCRSIDFDEDGVITVFDLAIVKVNFNKKYTY